MQELFCVESNFLAQFHEDSAAACVGGNNVWRIVDQTRPDFVLNK